MSTRMLIDATHSEETRVAIVKGTRVEDFDFESATKKQLKGNIYLAKVTRVEPSLQAAFVDYGGNRHGFLAFSEIHPDYYQIPVEDREALIAEEREAAAEEDEHGHDNGEADDANGENGGNGNGNGNGDVEAIVSHHDDVTDEVRRRARRIKRRYKIQEVIRRRQILLVQVVKEERGNKGAALTTYLSLAGRYCVLMPNTHHGGGISRKIANPQDRRKLKETLQDLNLPEGMACIIRTAGLSRSKAEIRRDFDYLQRTWDEIRELTLKSIAPALIYEEGDLIKRAIRDLYNKDIDDILVEGEEGYKLAKSFMRLLMPSHAKKVKHYKDRVPLFHRYQVEGQLDAMYNPVVQLKSGGYIVINPTEALVAIDVNSGKATREHNIEETALRTNLEAAEEAARQIRLRDMAGLIVIDFIDMEDRGNNRTVERKLKECLKADRARIQVGKISAFGLMEMSRQRLRPGLLEASTMPCPHCEGTGIIRSVESSALHVLRAIEEEGIRGRSAVVHLHLPAAVALYLLNQKRRQISDIENHYGFRLIVEVDQTLVAPKFRMERESLPRDVERERDGEMGEPVIIVDEDDEVVAEEPEDQDAEAANGGGDRDERRKRRRRRRRRPGDRHHDDTVAPEPVAAEANGDAEADTDEGEEHETGTAGEAVSADSHDARKRRRRGRRGGRRRGRGVESGAEGQDLPLFDDGQPAAEEALPSEAGPDLENEAGIEAEPEAVAVAEVDAAPETVAAVEAEPEQESQAEPVAVTEPAEAAAEQEAAPPKKRTRRSRKAEAEPAAEQPTAEEPAPKAKAPRRRKAETEEPAPAAPQADAEAQPEAEAQAQREAELEPEPEPVAAPDPAARHVASAPVKVTEVGSEAGSGEPRRRGWWQRALGN